MSGLTDSPSDEKLDTLRATPFLSCFLQKKKKKNIDAHLVLNIRRTSVDSHFDHETYVYHEGKTVRKNVGIACFRIFGRNTSISFLRGHVFEDFARS